MPKPPADPTGLPLLNWRGAHHWAQAEAPCTYCFEPTHLRTDKGTPCHKVCAEAALARRQARTTARYRNQRIV